MGHLEESDSAPLGQPPPNRHQQLRRRPLSAPTRGRGPLLAGSISFTGFEKRRYQKLQQLYERRRPQTASGRQAAGCWRPDIGGSRRGIGNSAKAEENFRCLQECLAKTVEASSNFVADIRRLRKAGGLHRERHCASPDASGHVARHNQGEEGMTGVNKKSAQAEAPFAPPAVCLIEGIEPLALAKELGIHTIVDKITTDIVHTSRKTKFDVAGAGLGCGLRGAGKGGTKEVKAPLGLSATSNIRLGDEDEDHCYHHTSSPSSPKHQQQHLKHQPLSPPVQCWSSGAEGPFRSRPSSPPVPVVSKRKKRPKEDVERLRRIVRATMISVQTPPSPSGTGSGDINGTAGSGAWGCGALGALPPQWSQKHEACLADMRRKLRQTGSPLLRAKDPAVLIAALLRRKAPLIRRLDEAVMSLEDTSEALDSLVSVASRLRLAGVSADALFIRAGVVQTGAGESLGATPTRHDTTRGGVGGRRGQSRKAGGKEPAVRRCSIRRIHAEIHRVLGDVASHRELKMALSACVGGGRSARGDDTRDLGGGAGGSGLEWITVDQLDHSLRTCHLTRRALDPQGASHPPLTGKKVACFLDEMERSLNETNPPLAPAVAATAAGTSSNAANILLGKHRVSPQYAGSRVGDLAAAERRRRGRRAAIVRRREGKWNDEDRDLAERELAGVIVERQQRFVEGYVRERRRYLNRRVFAQREGHGGFHSEGGLTRPGGRPSRKALAAAKAEFAEAVNRTKVVLKLLEAKTTASSLPQTGGGGGHALGDPTGSSRAIGVSEKCKTTANSSGEVQRNRATNGKASAAATHNEITAHSSPPKNRDSTTSKRAVAKDGDNDGRRNMKKVLRISTEAYSDRVRNQGGGVSRGLGVGGGASGGRRRGGVRGRMAASAYKVQVAFRRRMFHRFVWAQAYLRSPTHCFGLFKRCTHVPHGSATVANAVAPRLLTATGGTAIPSVSTAAASVVALTDSALEVTSIDAWPENPGFSIALPHHVHAADLAFLEYVRWRRQRESSLSEHFSQNLPAAGEGVEADRTPSNGSATPGNSAPPSATPTQAQVQGQQQQRPEGAQLFERKHAVRMAAVLTMLTDLRVPFLPGALDAAMEDLQKTIELETSAAAATAATGSKCNITALGGRDCNDDTGGSAMGFTPPSGGASNKVGGGRNKQHGGRLSFAGWYSWWIRHLPFDPASTGCLLKTVRCAKALHAAEVSSAATAFA